MRIAVLGTPKRVEELKQKVSSNHELIEVKNTDFEGYDLIFDLDFDDHPEHVQFYQHLKGVPVMVSAVKVALEAAVHQLDSAPECIFYGLNALPTFINRSLTEMTSLREEDRAQAESLLSDLGWTIQWVESRVGMVTPRIVLMIINEAFYTVQEGTASKQDIDTGMRLGTAYPKGPFEWCDEIGIKDVYEVLEALYQDTHDERYKVCPLLKKAYLTA